jgi:ubiquinone/menaquinone biosynthesis C-methylase UbiE
MPSTDERLRVSELIRSIKNSLWFALSALISAVVSLVAFLIIVLREGISDYRFHESPNHQFLVDKTRTIMFYGIFSSIYDVVNAHFYTHEMRDLVMKLGDIDKASMILDVGCGTGYTTEAILERAVRGQVVGVDLTPEQIQRAKENLRMDKARLQLVRADVDNLPFKCETFDAVVSAGAIEYFPDPANAVQEMEKVVRRGGKIVVGGPEFNWFRGVFLNTLFYTPSTRELMDFFIDARLKDVKSVFTGVATVFRTERYAVIMVGTKGT